MKYNVTVFALMVVRTVTTHAQQNGLDLDLPDVAVSRRAYFDFDADAVLPCCLLLGIASPVRPGTATVLGVFISRLHTSNGPTNRKGRSTMRRKVPAVGFVTAVSLLLSVF